MLIQQPEFANQWKSYLPILQQESYHQEPSKQVLMQWDSDFLSFQESRQVLNCREAKQHVENAYTMRHLLQQSGIQVASSQQHVQRVYIVHLFQTEILALYRQKKSKAWLQSSQFNANKHLETIPLTSGGAELGRVKRLAIRAIYSCGLDFGMVVIGILPERRSCVIQIDPTPPLTPLLTRNYARAFQKYIGQLKQHGRNAERLLIGADPEFVLFSGTNQLVLASKYFPKKGQVGCDSIWLRGDSTHVKLPLAELRPLPAKEPRQLILNLYQAMLAGIRKINNSSIKWLAGSAPLKEYPIGGHLHFSHVPCNFRLLRALDNYLTLPLFLLEDIAAQHRRPRYGWLGDFRMKFHGGFEYRTPPSWLVTPRITKGVIALAKVILHNYPQLRQQPLLRVHVNDAYYQGNYRLIKPIVQELWAELEATAEYRTYRHYLDPFKELIDSEYRWDEKEDIRPAWKLPPFHKQKTRLNRR